jgi:hypothetical protein
MRLLKKKFGEDLQSEYKLPKINKKYKGEIQNVVVPSNISVLAKSRSSVHVQATTNDPSANANTSLSSIFPVDGADSSANSSAATSAKTPTSTLESVPREGLTRQQSEPFGPVGGVSPGLGARSPQSGTPGTTITPMRRQSTMSKIFVDLGDTPDNRSFNDNRTNSVALSRSYTEARPFSFLLTQTSFLPVLFLHATGQYKYSLFHSSKWY